MNEENQSNNNNIAKNVTKKGAEIAANSVAGPIGGAAVNLISKTKIGDAILNSLSKIALISTLLSGCLLPFIIFIMIGSAASFAANKIAKDNSVNNDIASTTEVTGECGFSLKETSLTKDEYISKITDYSKKNNISKDFVDNAGDIYDLAKSKNLNPEMVIVRAISEGGINSTTGKYNHWGIGCTNTGGLKACHNYSSFMDGVEGFLNNISKYDSLESMMSKYAYIGKYWYNPGSAGKGGCYYSKYIYPDGIPERVKTACSDKYKNCSGSKCIKTTDDDQSAYAKWQVNKMAEHREKVFGLKSDEGVSCSASIDNNNAESSFSEYPLEHNNLKILHTQLDKNEREKITEKINSAIKNTGYGTGKGVAAAASTFILELAEKGYYSPFYPDALMDKNNIGFPNIGGIESCAIYPHKYKPTKDNQYCRSGLSGPGFVGWAISNACNPSFSSNLNIDITESISKLDKKISIDKVKPGDLLVSPGNHIMIVIKNNNGNIIFAESHSNREVADSGGVVFSSSKNNKSLSLYEFEAVDMSEWYSTNCQKSG